MRSAHPSGQYLPVKDSLQVPVSVHFSKHGASHSEMDDMEMFSGNTDHKVETHISNGISNGSQLELCRSFAELTSR